MKLSKAFYQSDDVVGLARDFLGKVLVTAFDGNITAGIITETEAYAGITDRASHAYGGRNTIRTAPMYLGGGHAYVYLIYGIHSLFNIVTGPPGTPHAVLVRAVYPLEGIASMLKRRKQPGSTPDTSGPGKLAQALGIHYDHSGEDLTGERIWIEDRGLDISNCTVSAGPRIGIEYAGEDALLPFRFLLGWPGPGIK